MMGYMARILWILLWLAGFVGAQPQYRSGWGDPNRDEWQKPEEVIRVLAIHPQEVIADIGAGSGYFARRLARYAGKVYAVDVDAKALKQAAAGAPSNLIPVLAAPDDPKLPRASVDTVFFCNALHHIPNRVEYLRRLLEVLTPAGRIVNIDFHKRPLPVGPGLGHKLDEQEVRREFEAAGYKLTKEYNFLPYQYFQVFEKK